MQIGDVFLTPSGSMYRLDNLSELDECYFFHMDAGVKLPPIPRTIAEARLQNLSETIRSIEPVRLQRLLDDHQEAA